jgi:hypothetical protein
MRQHTRTRGHSSRGGAVLSKLSERDGLNFRQQREREAAFGAESLRTSRRRSRHPATRALNAGDDLSAHVSNTYVNRGYDDNCCKGLKAEKNERAVEVVGRQDQLRHGSNTR